MIPMSSKKEKLTAFDYVKATVILPLVIVICYILKALFPHISDEALAFIGFILVIGLAIFLGWPRGRSKTDLTKRKTYIGYSRKNRKHGGKTGEELKAEGK
jgi:hypothetical protein